MKLYLIERTDDVEYDEYDSAVVAAESSLAARKVHPDARPGAAWTDGPRFPEWASPASLCVTYLGVAKPHTKRGVVLASYLSA